MRSEAPPPQVTLAHLAADGADAVRIAETAANTWRQVESALAPIIGRRGVSALYKRSLYLARVHHPCLTALYASTGQLEEVIGLQAALSQQTAADAQAAHDALLRTFHDLLSNLIGPSLTQRLLGPIWDNPSNGTAVQDTSP
jgi:hypothetical protein